MSPLSKLRVRIANTSRPLIASFVVLSALLVLGGAQVVYQLLEWSVPDAQADIKFIKATAQNTCESSGCHAGLKVVEQIHPRFALTCVACHGGNAKQKSKSRAHVSRPSTATLGRFPLRSGSHLATRNPVELRGPRAYKKSDPNNHMHRNAGLLAYRQFINPGDLLVANKSCGASGCHKSIVANVKRSLHTTMAGLMNGVYYVNGHPSASAGALGDFAGDDSDKEATMAIVLPKGNAIVDPHFDSSIAGTVARLGLEVPRNDETLRNAKKSDPLGMVSFYVQTDCARCHISTGGNKDVGTARSIGCSACHVTYLNEAFSESFDQRTPKNEFDHAEKHRMVRFPSVEQCAHCHNRGARHTQRFLGFRERPQGDNSSLILNENGDNTRVKDEEVLADGKLSGGRKGGFYPEAPLYMKPGDKLFGRPFPSYPPGVGAKNVVLGKSNDTLWRRDMRVNEKAGDDRNPFWIVDEDRTNNYDETPPDVHAEAGMICVDCHTEREMHGDGHIYTDRFHKVEITCESCHGTADQRSTLKTRMGNSVSRLSKTGRSYFLRLKANGESRAVPQLKDIIDEGANSNALGPSHDDHDRLECYACHATWHDQCNSCHMITSYDTVRDSATSALEIRPSGDREDCRDDPGCFYQRSHMDNVKRNATQGQPRFVTTYDQLILGINNKGKIQNFHTSGQAVLFANKLVGGQGSEKALHESNFLELSQCVAGVNAGELCEVDADCPGSTCPSFSCDGGPFDTLTAQAEAQCGRCEFGGTPTGELCGVDETCAGAGELCNRGTLAGRMCFGGATPGAPCTWDPDNPTDPAGCGTGTCGVRMYNFVFSTLDEDDAGTVRHLPAFAMNPMFPHTVRKIPRNCDNCHLNPTLSNLDEVKKAIGLGTGMAPVLDASAPGGKRQVSITRRVRIATNGKGALAPDILNVDLLPADSGDLVDIAIDKFIDVDFAAGKDIDVDVPPFDVTAIRQVKPTTHVSTGPLDAAAIEALLSATYAPQSPTSLSARSGTFVASRTDAYLGTTSATFGAKIVTPKPGSRLRSSTITLRWKGYGTNPRALWRIYVGTKLGRANIQKSRVYVGGTAAKIYRLPRDGQALYVRLWYRNSANQQWHWEDAEYQTVAKSNRSRSRSAGKSAPTRVNSPRSPAKSAPTRTRVNSPRSPVKSAPTRVRGPINGSGR